MGPVTAWTASQPPTESDYVGSSLVSPYSSPASETDPISSGQVPDPNSISNALLVTSVGVSRAK